MTQEREIHIAHVTYALHAGGMENSIFQIANSQFKAGFKVDVITTEEPGEWFGRARSLNLAARHIPGVDWAIPVLHALKVGRFLRKANYNLVAAIRSPLMWPAWRLKLPYKVVGLAEHK